MALFRQLRSELIARVAAQNPLLYARDVEAVVTAILSRISEALTVGDRVELRDFGAFTTRELQTRTGRDPRTGEAVTVAAKRYVAFRPGKAMRTQLNRGRDSPEQDTEPRLLASWPRTATRSG